MGHIKKEILCMQIELLYPFPEKMIGRNIARAWHWYQEKSMIALTYVSDMSEIYPLKSSLSFLLFDVEARRHLSLTTFSIARVNIEALQLTYHVTTQTWIVGSLELQMDSSSYHIVIRALRQHTHEPGMSLTTLFDEPANGEAPIGPILALYTQDNTCIALYRKPAIDFSAETEIRRIQIDLSTGQIASSLKQFADSALVSHHHTASLLLALEPQWSERAQQTGGSADSWGLSLTNYDEYFNSEQWYYRPLIQQYAGSCPLLQAESDFEWLGVNATVIAGPPLLSPDQPTIVIGATIMDIFHLRGFGHTSVEASLVKGGTNILCCLDSDGHLLHVCREPIGLRLHLCYVSSMVVGVDVLAGRWRLWNWNASQDDGLQSKLWLHPNVVAAYILAEQKTQEQWFWLVEELDEGIQVTKRDVMTLIEIVPLVILPKVHLLETQNASGSLDWYTQTDILPCQGTLLVLGVNEEEQLSLYQVR
jgi:hypothetical protein